MSGSPPGGPPRRSSGPGTCSCRPLRIRTVVTGSRPWWTGSVTASATSLTGPHGTPAARISAMISDRGRAPVHAATNSSALSRPSVMRQCASLSASHAGAPVTAQNPSQARGASGAR